MSDRQQDQAVLGHIQELVEEEQRLYAGGSLSERQQERLKEVQVELDQYWDLLRRRRAQRSTGEDSDRETGVALDDAGVRPADVVEHYEQ